MLKIFKNAVLLNYTVCKWVRQLPSLSAVINIFNISLPANIHSMYLIISACSKTSEKIIGMHVFHVIKITLIKGFAFTKPFDVIFDGTRKTSGSVTSTAQWNGRFDTSLSGRHLLMKPLTLAHHQQQINLFWLIN